MSEPVYLFDGADPAMEKAHLNAQQSFKYFWRELSWENRRIVPALDMAMVKLPFTDGPRTDGNPAYEHMWIGDVTFDGETLSGTLLNSPNWLASVKEGDPIFAPFSHLEDWMMVFREEAFGGFTVNVLRAKMNPKEREQHDNAWGLKFGDPTVIRTELDGGGVQPAVEAASFRDHPMCVNILENVDEQLRADSSITTSVDDDGWTLLQREALAGNLGVVKLLVRHGADVAAKNPLSRTASELARGIGWPEIADYLDQSAKGGNL